MSEEDEVGSRMAKAHPDRYQLLEFLEKQLGQRKHRRRRPHRVIEAEVRRYRPIPPSLSITLYLIFFRPIIELPTVTSAREVGFEETRGNALTPESKLTFTGEHNRS